MRLALMLALLAGAVPAWALAQADGGASRQAQVGKPLPAWSTGELDIHHIHTGRGDALLFVFPDGTSLLKDASGRTTERPPFSFPTRPDATRPPGEWVARHVRRALPRGARGLDYALLSHFHGDHMGVIDAQSPPSRLGDYRLSGITQVAELLPIGRLIDRGWPGYDAPRRIDTPTMANYRRFVDWQVRHRGLVMERFQPGRNDQIRLLHQPAAYPQFEVRNLYANGELWTGAGSATRWLAPPGHDAAAGPQFDENKLSIAFRLRYGRFDYFSGGDLSSIDEETSADAPAWLDVETPVARASGPVDVLKANHHASWDANSVSFLAALQPRVIVVTARADGHPAVNTYRRMTSTRVWPGARDIFITHLSAATATTTYGSATAAATQGHVVVRVAPGGESYRVFMLDDRDESMRVTSVHGPYVSR
ncbi:ComEC/Rec2 family competence protein [Luteimonas sp. SDU101]|uniref:ComEC/Rec2 family competence protein n=1 Tax=Luteimonas sp. SDU101 TaxID=3422593 RepID=UPI003EBD924B